MHFRIDGIQLKLFTASDRFGKWGERGFSVILAMADYNEFFFVRTWIQLIGKVRWKERYFQG